MAGVVVKIVLLPVKLCSKGLLKVGSHAAKLTKKICVSCGKVGQKGCGSCAKKCTKVSGKLGKVAYRNCVGCTKKVKRRCRCWTGLPQLGRIKICRNKRNVKLPRSQPHVKKLRTVNTKVKHAVHACGLAALCSLTRNRKKFQSSGVHPHDTDRSSLEPRNGRKVPRDEKQRRDLKATSKGTKTKHRTHEKSRELREPVFSKGRKDRHTLGEIKSSTDLPDTPSQRHAEKKRSKANAKPRMGNVSRERNNEHAVATGDAKLSKFQKDQSSDKHQRSPKQKCQSDTKKEAFDSAYSGSFPKNGLPKVVKENKHQKRDAHKAEPPATNSTKLEQVDLTRGKKAHKENAPLNEPNVPACHPSNTNLSPDFTKEEFSDEKRNPVFKTPQHRKLPGRTPRPYSTSSKQCKDELPRKSRTDAANRAASQGRSTNHYKDGGDSKRTYGTNNSRTLKSNKSAKKSLNRNSPSVNATITEPLTEKNQEAEAFLHNPTNVSDSKNATRYKPIPKITSRHREQVRAESPQQSDSTLLSTNTKNKERTQTSRNPKSDKTRAEVAEEGIGVAVPNTNFKTSEVHSYIKSSNNSIKEQGDACEKVSEGWVREQNAYTPHGTGAKHSAKAAEQKNQTKKKTADEGILCPKETLEQKEHQNSFPVECSQEHRGAKGTNEGVDERGKIKEKGPICCKNNDRGEEDRANAGTLANVMKEPSHKRRRDRSHEVKSPPTLQPGKNKSRGTRNQNAKQKINFQLTEEYAFDKGSCTRFYNVEDDEQSGVHAPRTIEKVDIHKGYDKYTLYGIECPLRSESFD